MTQHVVVLLIMDMESAKSDVNGKKKKVHFLRILIKKWQKHQKKNLKMYRLKLNKTWISKKLKMVLSHYLPFQYKILFVNTRFFSLAECTIHTKNLVPYTKTKKNSPKNV